MQIWTMEETTKTNNNNNNIDSELIAKQTLCIDAT